MTFLETKRHLQKPDEIYRCGLLSRGAGWVILSYVSRDSASVAGRQLEPGTTTAAYYVDGEGWVLWKMSTSKGALIGHLFHIVRDLHIGDSDVSYTDLVLDLWVEPGGPEDRTLQVLDEDELSEELTAGRVSGEDERLARSLLVGVERQAGELIERLDLLLVDQSF